MRIIKITAKTVLILLFLLILALPVIFIVSTTDEAYSIDQVIVNYYISDFDTEKQRVDAIQQACEKYCKSKTLRKIECLFNSYTSILEKDGEISYSFDEFNDNSKEGGNVSNSTIYYKTNNNNIYKIELSDGAGKAIALGGTDLNPQNWTMSINEIVDSFVEKYTNNKLFEVPHPYLKVTIANDKAVCLLFSEDKKGYIEEVVFPLT